MITGVNLANLKQKANLKNRYEKQLLRLKGKTDCIEKAVSETMKKLTGPGITSMVIYGEFVSVVFWPSLLWERSVQLSDLIVSTMPGGGHD